MSIVGSRPERDTAVAQLTAASQTTLMHKLVEWTLVAQATAEEGRELRQRRGEARAWLELIAAEIRARKQPALPVAAEEASA
jgi:hypothetical protein